MTSQSSMGRMIFSIGEITIVTTYVVSSPYLTFRSKYILLDSRRTHYLQIGLKYGGA